MIPPFIIAGGPGSVHGPTAVSSASEVRRAGLVPRPRDLVRPGHDQPLRGNQPHVAMPDAAVPATFRGRRAGMRNRRDAKAPADHRLPDKTLSRHDRRLAAAVGRREGRIQTPLRQTFVDSEKTQHRRGQDVGRQVGRTGHSKGNCNADPGARTSVHRNGPVRVHRGCGAVARRPWNESRRGKSSSSLPYCSCATTPRTTPTNYRPSSPSHGTWRIRGSSRSARTWKTWLRSSR